MPSSCCAPGCTNRLQKGSSIRMYRFLIKDPERRDKWLIKIGRLPGLGQTSIRSDGLWEPKEHDRLCSSHFVKGKPSSDPSDVDYAPSIFSHTPLQKKTPQVLQLKLDRQNRARERNDTKAKSAAAVALLSLAEDCENLRPDESEFQPLSDSKYVNASTQTDNRSTFDILNATKLNELSNEQKEQIDRQIEMIDKLLNMNSVLTEQSQKLRQELDRLELKMNQLQEKNKLLEEKTKRCFSADFIANDDNKTSYYTGLANYATFEVVFQHTVKHVKRKRTKLSLKDELLLTLVKLRQNCGMEDLAYRFGISAGSVTKIFHIWLNALHKSLAALVTWPPLDKEMQLPEVFQNENFCKVKCIIDCTEIFIERPSSLKARAQTYSNYKNITP